MVEVELIERKKERKNERVTLHSKAGFVMCKGKNDVIEINIQKK